MNTLKIDFQQTPKSKWRVFIGILMVLLSVTYFFLAVYSSDKFWLGFIYCVFFFLMGITHITEGSGHTFSKYFGEAFLLIDEENYEFKPSQYKSATKIQWKNVESIKFGTTSIVIIDESSKVSEIEFSRFSYQQVQDIKSALNSIAEKHDININN